MSEHQLWNELGNVYVNSGAIEQAIKSYKKAIDADPKFGWAYTNIALAYMKLGEPENSIPSYQRSIELLDKFSDKAVVWHLLGQSYQAMDDKKNTILAFQRAVDLDLDNTVYRNDLAVAMAEYAYEEEEDVDVAQSAEDEKETEVVDVVQETAEEILSVPEVAEETDAVPDSERSKSIEIMPEIQAVAEVEMVKEVEDVVLSDEDDIAEASLDHTDEVASVKDEFGSWIEKTVEKLNLKSVEKKSAAFEDNPIIFPEGVSKEEVVAELMSVVENQATKTAILTKEEADVAIPADLAEEIDSVEAVEGIEVVAEVEQKETIEIVEENEEAVEEIPSAPAAIAKDLMPVFNEMSAEDLDADVDDLINELSKEIALVQEDEEADEDEFVIQTTLKADEFEYETFSDELVDEFEYVEEEDQLTFEDGDDEDQVEEDEGDEDNEEDVIFFEEEEKEVVAAFVAAQNGQNGNGKNGALELNTAKVWGDLGNIFFSAGIFDGALIAYEKAIKLDAQFAPVLNNLALLHVRNGEYLQAVDLYRKSIDLLGDNPEKSVSWNNLGNTYRVLEEYEQAEVAYRKADELDTNKIVLEKWMQYGLLSTVCA